MPVLMSKAWSHLWTSQRCFETNAGRFLLSIEVTKLSLHASLSSYPEAAELLTRHGRLSIEF
jgi:hypothetical protein